MTDDLRAAALNGLMAAIDAADPTLAVHRALADRKVEPGPGGRVQIIALGKAAIAMAEEAMHMLGRTAPVSALIVTNEENARAVDGAEVLVGAHPVPNVASARAGTRILAELSHLGPNDRAVVLISGGGSALAVAPGPGISLADKVELNALLLASGLDIVEMNALRRPASRLKGGGMLRAAFPAPVLSLILSDVIGDRLDAIASGPTVPPQPDGPDPRTVANRGGIWSKLPASVRACYGRATNGDALSPVENVLVGSNGGSVKAAAKALSRYRPRLLDAPVLGDVSEAAAALIREAGRSFVGGGETTVILKGDGKGGRNQELALRFALLAEHKALKPGWAFLSGGTDGRDGPTDAAGGIVDAGTIARARAAGCDVEALLDNNDAYTVLDAAGDLVRIPATGTNVADIQIFLRK